MAIQLIINRELGLAKNENPIQGAFIIEELTDLVEEAVLMEFDSITERGGDLGAMETMYQRSKIQEESLYYESLKHSGDYPIIGVNTFLSSQGSPTAVRGGGSGATKEERQARCGTSQTLREGREEQVAEAVEGGRGGPGQGGDLCDRVVDAPNVCSLRKIS